jgi:hypothetical protein
MSLVLAYNRIRKFEIHQGKDYEEIDDGRPNMPALLKVMRDLNRFKGSNTAPAHP